MSEISFSHNGYRYNLTVDWDDYALEKGEIAFPITASSTSLETKKVSEIHAEVGVKAEGDTALLYITIKGITAFEMPIQELFNEESIVGRAIEKVHASFILVDPIVGCLVRSGLSVAVGQILKCKAESITEKWLHPRLSSIAKCLRKNIPNMLVKTALRAGRCVFRAGF
jgi:hypothetical protein